MDRKNEENYSLNAYIGNTTKLVMFVGRPEFPILQQPHLFMYTIFNAIHCYAVRMLLMNVRHAPHTLTRPTSGSNVRFLFFFWSVCFVSARVFALGRSTIAITRAYGCDGVSVLMPGVVRRLPRVQPATFA